MVRLPFTNPNKVTVAFSLRPRKKSVSKPRRKLMRVMARQVCSRKPFFHHRVFESASVQAVGYEEQSACPLCPQKQTCAVQQGSSHLRPDLATSCLAHTRGRPPGTATSISLG